MACVCKTFRNWSMSTHKYYDAEMACVDCGDGKIHLNNNHTVNLEQNN